LGELEHLAENVLPVGLEDGTASNEQDVEVARKVRTEIAVGFAELTAGAIALVGSEAYFFAGDDP